MGESLIPCWAQLNAAEGYMHVDTILFLQVLSRVRLHLISHLGLRAHWEGRLATALPAPVSHPCLILHHQNMMMAVLGVLTAHPNPNPRARWQGFTATALGVLTRCLEPWARGQGMMTTALGVLTSVLCSLSHAPPQVSNLPAISPPSLTMFA